MGIDLIFTAPVAPADWNLQVVNSIVNICHEPSVVQRQYVGGRPLCTGGLVGLWADT
jgi:hypothetical protein